MIDFIQGFNRISPLNEEATSDLLHFLQTKTVSKGDTLLKRNTICKHLFFINEGLCKTLFYKEQKELIMYFFAENDFFTVLNSFLPQIPSEYTVMALETTTYTFIQFTDLENLCQKHHCIETFFRKLLADAAVKMMKRISEMLKGNASECYAAFVTNYSHLLQRISLGDVANFMGVTQVTLSRIRALK